MKFGLSPIIIIVGRMVQWLHAHQILENKLQQQTQSTFSKNNSFFLLYKSYNILFEKKIVGIDRDLVQLNLLYLAQRDLWYQAQQSLSNWPTNYKQTYASQPVIELDIYYANKESRSMKQAAAELGQAQRLLNLIVLNQIKFDL